MAPPAWAYQPEYFITPPDDELICSICSLVFCEPTECPCQHAFCRNCIQRWLDRQRDCPICRKPVFMPVRPSAPFIRNLIAKMKMRCHNKEAGCEANFALEACEHHLKECEFELVECVCGKSVVRKDVQKHNSSECPYGRDSMLLLNDTSDAEKEKNQIKKEMHSLRGKAIGKMAVRVSRPVVSNVCTVDPVTPSPAFDSNPLAQFPSISSSSVFSPWSAATPKYNELHAKKREMAIKLARRQLKSKVAEDRNAKLNKIAEIKKHLLGESGFALTSPPSSIYAKVNSSGKRSVSSSKGGESSYSKIQILSSNLPSFLPTTSSASGKAGDPHDNSTPQGKTAPSLFGFAVSGSEKDTNALNYNFPSSSSSDISSEKKKIAAIKNSLLNSDFMSFPSTSSASNYSSASSDAISEERKKKIAAIKNSLFGSNDFPCFPSTSSACATPKTSETSNAGNVGSLEEETSTFDDMMKKIRHTCLKVSKIASNNVKVRPEVGEGGTDVCDIVYDSRLDQDSAKEKVSNSSSSDQKSHDVYEIHMDDDYSPSTYQPPGSPSSSGENFQLPFYPKVEGSFSDENSGSSGSFARTEQKATTFINGYSWEPSNWKPLLSGPKNTTQFFHQMPLQKASTSTLSSSGMQNGEASNFHELSVSDGVSQMHNQASALQDPTSWESSEQDQFIYSCGSWNYWNNYDG